MNPNRKNRRAQEAMTPKHAIPQPQPRVQLPVPLIFPSEVRPLSAEQVALVEEACKTVNRSVHDHKELQTIGQAQPNAITKNPETGETVVVFYASFAVPLEALVGHTPKGGTLLGPRGEAIGVEQAIAAAIGGTTQIDLRMLTWHDPEKKTGEKKTGERDGGVSET